MFTYLHNIAGILSWAITFRTVLYATILTLVWKFIMDKLKNDPRLEKFAKTLPGPRTIPIVGNGLEFLYNMDGRMTILKTYEKRFGPMFRLWFGKHLVVVLADANDLERVVTSSKTINKPDLFAPAKEFLGEYSMFTTTWRTWRKTRKELQPFFTKKILSPRVPRINEIINVHLTHIKKLADGPEFDLLHYQTNLIYEVLMEILFNVKLNPEDQDCTKLDNCLTSAGEIFIAKMFKPWEQNAILDYILYHKQKTEFKTETTRIYNKYIARTSSESSRNASLSHNQSDEKSESNNPISILPTLYKLGDELGEQYIKDEALIMISAGIHTTSITISFFLLAVSMHPEIQEKLYQEIQKIFGNDDREPTADDVENMPYLDQVLKEVERYYTLVPTIFRQVDSDVKIGEKVLPSGTAILIPLNNIHMNSKYYKNPHQFNPDHFTPEAVSNRPKHAFMPFSAGSRNCVGKVLAVLEMKLILVTYLRNLQFTTSMKEEDIILIPGEVMTSLNGYNVKVQLRE